MPSPRRLAVELRPEEWAAAFKISFARRSSRILPLERTQPCPLVRRQPSPLTGIDLSPAHPLAQRLMVDAQLRRDRLDRLPLRRVLAWCSNTIRTARSAPPADTAAVPAASGLTSAHPLNRTSSHHSRGGSAGAVAPAEHGLGSGRSIGVSGSGHGVDAPLPGDASERVPTRAAERDRGPEDEVPDRLRDENLTGSGEIRYASGDLDGDTAHVLTSRITLPAVQAGTSVVPSRAEVTDDRTRRTGWPGQVRRRRPGCCRRRRRAAPRVPGIAQ